MKGLGWPTPCMNLFGLAFLDAGAAGTQSALSPAADQSQRISSLWWLFFYVTLAVYVLVLLATLVSILRNKQRHGSSGGEAVMVADVKQDRRMTRMVGGSLGLTIAILFAFMLSDFFTGRAMHVLSDPDPLRIEITGHRWWWEVKYKDLVPSNMVVTANEIHVPVGKTVQLELKSTDVIHSFWAPNFNGKKDLIPGHPATNWFRAQKAGEYRGQCAEYCGYQHAHMRFMFVAEAPDQFERWRQKAAQSAIPPATAEQKRGQDVFLNGPCVMCHTISGTDANATVGPNLSHVASRKLLGAASFLNTPEFMRLWIRDAQHFKPGIVMPQQNLREKDVASLVVYLETLK